MRVPTPLEVALAQLVSHDPMIRKLGAQALCNLRPRQEASAIQEAFRLERSEGVAKWLALALGKIGDKGSIAVLSDRLKTQPDNDLRHWILVARNMLQRFVSGRDITRRLESMDPSVNKEGLILAWNNPRTKTGTAKRQRQLLDSDDPGVRRWASLSLGSRKDFTVDEQVLSHLQDPDYLALEWTEHVIAGKAPESAMPKLLANLTHLEPRVREWAIKALAATGANGVYELLMKHFESEPDDLCRDAVIRSLAPVSALIEVQDFLMKCIRQQTIPVILAALIDVAATSEPLRRNHNFAAALVEKTQRANNDTLKLALTRAFSAHLSADDRKLLDNMGNSESAQDVWNVIGTMPWIVDDQGGRLARPHRTERKIPVKLEMGEFIVAVLIAKKEEFRAFAPLMGAYQPIDDPDTGKSVYTFRLQGTSGQPILVVALFAGGMGTDRSSLWAQRLNADWQPSILVNIGIAGGIHEDVRLGDVVVATQVENYIADAKAVPATTAEQFHFELAGDAFKTDPILASKLQNLEFSHVQVFSEWQKAGADASLEISEQQRTDLLRKDFLREKPTLEEGHIASGPIVGAAEAFVKWLKGRGDRSFLALEMESAGPALAIHEGGAHTRYLVIRGISDFGDERKKELDEIGKGGIRRLAMQNATRLLTTLLTNVEVLAFDVRRPRHE